MNTRGAAKVWQVLGSGEGFLRDCAPANFELSGFVRANDSSAAWTRAIEIARSQWLELAQADGKGIPRAVINPDEIEDASGLKLDAREIDQVEIAWKGASDDV